MENVHFYFPLFGHFYIDIYKKVAIIPFCKSNCHFHSSLFQSGNKLFTSLYFAVLLRPQLIITLSLFAEPLVPF